MTDYPLATARELNKYRTNDLRFHTSTGIFELQVSFGMYVNAILVHGLVPYAGEERTALPDKNVSEKEFVVFWERTDEVATDEPDPDELAAEELVGDAIHFSQYGAVDDGIDRVIQYFDVELGRSNWRACELALLRATPELLDEAVALAFLSMTFAERNRLERCRKKFMGRLKNVLAKRYKPNEVSELLYGLW